jgi:hypothetical protein
MGSIHKEWTVMPHGPLTEVEEGLLTVTGEFKAPVGKFPRRMTVVALKGDRTAIWSAIPLDEEGMARIEAIGEPSVLIVPSGTHRMDAAAWKERYPEIKVLAPPGAVEAVEKVVPVDDVEGGVLDDPQVHFRALPGTEGMEAALEVRRGEGLTLILNDVIAHVAHPPGLGAEIMARLFGFGVHEPEVPRTAEKMFIKDRPALAAQFRDWAADPQLQRILVSHGDPIEGDAAEVLQHLAAHLEH